ncbi:MAG: TIGR02301 family protein, partial [Xanthobacteraceae bacterium]
MSRHLAAALVIAPLVLAFASNPARAQPPAPYDGNLQRLAEIMGALH